MAYDEPLANRVRKMLAPVGDISERKMFGGLAFMLSGNMCCCIEKSNLIVRTGPEQYETALQRPTRGCATSPEGLCGASFTWTNKALRMTSP